MTTDNQHYCAEHQTDFKKFEKEGRTWYSHQNPDGTWHKEPQRYVPPPGFGGGDSETKIRSMALSYAKDLAVAGKIELKNITVCADRLLAYIQKAEKPQNPMQQAVKDVDGEIQEDWL